MTKRVEHRIHGRRVLVTSALVLSLLALAVAHAWLGLATGSESDVAYVAESMSEGLTYGETAGWRGSLPRRGEARVLAIRVGFSDIPPEDGFQEGDDADALQALIGRHIDGTISGNGTSEFPYESAYGYYLRSSYGQLQISGEAYDYEATRPRDDYADDPTTLFAEALEALDGDIDYADFDGDGDGTIDCVSIRFEGASERGGSTWWSQVFHTGYMRPDSGLFASAVPKDMEFDGLRIDSLMLLHNPSTDADAYAVFIHELGHTLGMPDYYANSHDPEEPSDEFVPGGIGTYDMMGYNQGDHNAFSKWMTGWLSDGDVIKVTCDESMNAVATIGGEVIASDDKGRVTLDLSGISSDSKDGKAKAVAIYPIGNDGRMGPLTDLYMLEYDTFEGNQSLYWGTQLWRQELTGGFRLFRIQATPKGSWQSLSHSNKTDQRHDQLIELVDPDNPDGEQWHMAGCSSDIVPTALAEIGEPARFGPQPLPRDGRYGCSLHVGDRVTPYTTPSTNFREDPEGGRTGIALKVLSSDSDGGTVRICYVGR